MNPKIQKAIELLKTMPEDQQQMFVDMILSNDERENYELSADERQAIEAGIADIAEGRTIGEQEFRNKLRARMS